MLAQPARFLDPGNKIEVTALSRSTKFAGNKEDVARFAATPKDTAVLLDPACDTDGNDRRSRRAAGFATDDRDREASSCPLQPAIKLLHPAGCSPPRDNQRDQRVTRLSGHGGKIAQRPHHRLP